MITPECISCCAVWTAIILLGLAVARMIACVREWVSDELPRD